MWIKLCPARPRFTETHSWASFWVVKIHNNLSVNGLLAMVLNTETTFVKFVKFYCPKNNTSLKHSRRNIKA
jgi:hypothetical protein